MDKVEYDNVLNKLYGLQHVGIKLGMENIAALMNELDNPHEKMKFLHIAGTNGKGSVCCILSKALEKVGYRVGFYSSPHLVSIRERFRVNGNGISRESLFKHLTDIWPYVEKLYAKGIKLTFFEVSVGIAIRYFYEENCDFVVWETGLGGRLDSTNIVNPVISAITGIGLDHQKFLDDTLGEIAKEKGGIIKEGIPVFTGFMDEEPLSVIKKIANDRNSPLTEIDDSELIFSRQVGSGLSGWKFYINNLSETSEDNNSFTLPLSGLIQPKNMLLAFDILKYLSQKYGFNLIDSLKGIADLKWFGRIQTLPDGNILDGAHNPQAMRILVDTIKVVYSNKKFPVIFGCLEERIPINVLRILAEIADEFIFVPIDCSRECFLPDNIISCLKSVNYFDIECTTAHSLKDAVQTVKGKKALITGSLYLAGETLLHYYKREEIINI